MVMHQEAQGALMIPCGHCGRLFKPRRSWQLYCSEECRSEFHQLHGIDGKVRRVSKIKRGGVSLTIHLYGTAAEKVQNLELGSQGKWVPE
jgi:hypothetical protein